MIVKKLSLVLLPVALTLSLHATDPFDDPFFKDPFGDQIFQEMRQMQQNMDKMFEKMQDRMNQRASGQITPLGTYKINKRNDFVDKGKHYEYMTDIPENKENQIEINAKDGVLSITAKIIQKQESNTTKSYSTSSSMQMYQQSLSLPTDADEGSLKASYKDKKLMITIEKKKEVQKIIPSIKINTPQKTKGNISTEQNSSIQKTTINSDLPSMS